EGKEYEIEVRNRRYDGEYRWWLTRAIPVKDPGAHVLMWYGFSTDIHDIKQSKEALRQSEEKLRQQAHELEQQLIASGRLVSLGEITASMAHEFNNPLGIVMGFAQDLLSETDPSSPQYQSLKLIDEANTEPVDGTDRMVVITVADTGFGIEKNDLPKIFQPFFTAKKGRGLGLGLPICQRIVKNHGGRIDVESQPGHGTTFKLY